MSSQPRSASSLPVRFVRRVDEFGTALGFAAGSRWWWFVLFAAVTLPIVAVALLSGDQPLVSPFVYRT